MSFIHQFQLIFPVPLGFVALDDLKEAAEVVDVGVVHTVRAVFFVLVDKVVVDSLAIDLFPNFVVQFQKLSFFKFFFTLGGLIAEAVVVAELSEILICLID